MKLDVYKGFNAVFLADLQKEQEPLVKNEISNKINVLAFDKKVKKNLRIALNLLEDDKEVWITYEEYALIKNTVNEVMEEEDLEVTIFKNNLYPDYYPIQFELSDSLVEEIEKNVLTPILLMIVAKNVNDILKFITRL